MDPDTVARVQRLQARIDAALREPEDEATRSTFSNYVPGGSTAIQSALWAQPATGSVDDLEAILDHFERFAASEDPGRLRHALTVVLTHHPTAAALGVRLPSLEERSPWKVKPSEPPP